MAKKVKVGAATPAVTALKAAGVAFTVHEYAFETAPGALGVRAAEIMGMPPERVFKTLMAELDGSEMVTAIIPVAAELDLKALARAAGAKQAAMAAVKDAERATGYVKGGISAVGQRRRHRCFIDEAAMAHASILVNGGRRGLQIELAPRDLIEATDAEVAAIVRS